MKQLPTAKGVAESTVIIYEFTELNKPLSARFTIDGTTYIVIDSRLSECERKAIVEELREGEGVKVIM